MYVVNLYKLNICTYLNVCILSFYFYLLSIDNGLFIIYYLSIECKQDRRFHLPLHSERICPRKCVRRVIQIFYFLGWYLFSHALCSVSVVLSTILVLKIYSPVHLQMQNRHCHHHHHHHKPNPKQTQTEATEGEWGLGLDSLLWHLGLVMRLSWSSRPPLFQKAS